MTYRQPPPDRLYVCRKCAAPEAGPWDGGAVVCSRCQTPHQLVDRGRVLAPQPTSALAMDPNRLAHLRAQDGRPRIPPATLVAVLGGPSIMPGREQEALLVWQNLRARAEANDVGASEDLTHLTRMLAQHPNLDTVPGLSRALAESALDAALLPRHRQEQLGRLARLAMIRGDRASADLLLAAMDPVPLELESDSEYRLALAVRATLDRDSRRVIELLGAQKDAVPIADSLDNLASVFRAHAYEMMGDAAAASHILKDLPDPRVLDLVRKTYSALRLCEQSAVSYVAAAHQAAGERAASAQFGEVISGGMFILIGTVMTAVGVGPAIVSRDTSMLALGVIGGVLLAAGVVVFVTARRKAKRAAGLRINGLSLEARVISASHTGSTTSHVPMQEFAVQVAGPKGPYNAAFRKLLSDDEAAHIIGQVVRVRAAPDNLSEIILEE